MKDTFVMAIFIQDQKILMGLRNYAKAALWTLPGGYVEEGEHYIVALKREIFEECGLLSEQYVIGNLIYQKDAISRSGVVLYYRCYLNQFISNQFEFSLEYGKFLEWGWFLKQEIPDNIIDPRDLCIIKNCLKDANYEGELKNLEQYKNRIPH